MHIPDGYLSPQTYLPLYAVSGCVLAVALKKVKTEVSTKEVPYLAMAAAFTFLIQMFNIPVPGGTTGHAVGAGIVALLLGPWTAVIAVSIALIVQALVFGDGGITAIGANIFNMAIVMPFVSYWTFKAVKGKRSGKKITNVASFLAGYLGLCIASLFAAVQFGIQPLIAHGADGRPLYAPYPLSIALPAMGIEHFLFFGIAEGLVTALLFSYILKHQDTPAYAMKGGIA
ncbi:MAG TPA: cobalamin biosynthesis protein CbiM [Deltaproteobacteria bacterium]|nr:cobalamin biosynthesis protein CbiM [Deltaproteobacteria bacterium]